MRTTSRIATTLALVAALSGLTTAVAAAAAGSDPVPPSVAHLADFGALVGGPFGTDLNAKLFPSSPAVDAALSAPEVRAKFFR
ncbi:hypothetical protein [Sinosporangium siamense]|uniref:Uncharacterized protein n=1 Tax=Sinosporangium siamense TaxID=1367973 RepID=A0A919RD18_9ACTN|nr:hypothetical protein [Sinosporangium siamense]GII90530.1 hypothetical protein Ssi02_07610 [Sinosporangium siamense]